MRFGGIPPTLGPLSGPDALVRAAQRADALDYDSAWVADRLPYPLAPSTPYPVTPDGSLPEYFERRLDPIEAPTYLGQMLPQLHALAKEAARNPAHLEVIYMTAAEVTAAPLDEGPRGVLRGSAAPVRADVGRLRDAGVTEVIGWSGGETVDAMLTNLERFRGAAR